MVSSIVVIDKEHFSKGGKLFRAEPTRVPRRELPSQIVRGLSTPGPITLSGPSGSGKSRTLFEISELLKMEDVPHALIHFADEDAIEKLHALPPEGVHLFDGIERADYETVIAIMSRSMTCAGVCTLRNEDEALRREESLQQFAREHPDFADLIAGTRHFSIAPLTRAESKQIAIDARVPIDSVTLSSVIDLSWGRPGWVLDLLQLASAGKVLADPFPAVGALDPSDFLLPIIRESSFAGHIMLTPMAVAAAVTLSSLEPRTMGGLADLVGEQILAELIESELILETPNSSELAGVPEIYAAALRTRADPELIHHQEFRIATQLLELETFGIPLPEREAHFCAHVNRQRKFDGSSSSEADRGWDESLARAHASVVEDVALNLISFARPGAKELLLRSRSRGRFDELSRIRAVGSLSGPIEAIRALGPRASHTPPDERTYTSEQYGLEYLREIFLAEVEPPNARPDSPGAERSDHLAQASYLFQRWNDPFSLGGDASTLLDIALQHPVPEIALYAEQLLAFENTRRGRSMRQLNDGSAARSDRIATLALNSPEGANDLLAAATITEGIIALLSATNITGSESILRIADKLPGTAFHKLWVRHLFTATTAIATGRVTLAAQEWKLFMQRAPRFLPWRLRAMILAIGAELDGVEHPLLNKHETARQLLTYFRGELERVDLPTPNAGDELAKITGAVPMDTLLLAVSHLQALEDQNPSALRRVSKALLERRLWAPAAYALQEARAIFLRRRATGSVSLCDHSLHALEQAARNEVPWFSLTEVSSTPRIGLTPRQLDAANLASTGLSNRDIAEQLNCSVRTVESHLAAARAKLGASSRDDLAHCMSTLGYA